jgi:hypothetical protein
MLKRMDTIGRQLSRGQMQQLKGGRCGPPTGACQIPYQGLCCVPCCSGFGNATLKCEANQQSDPNCWVI